MRFPFIFDSRVVSKVLSTEQSAKYVHEARNSPTRARGCRKGQTGHDDHDDIMTSWYTFDGEAYQKEDAHTYTHGVLAAMMSAKCCSFIVSWYPGLVDDDDRDLCGSHAGPCCGVYG